SPPALRAAVGIDLDSAERHEPPGVASAGRSRPCVAPLGRGRLDMDRPRRRAHAEQIEHDPRRLCPGVQPARPGRAPREGSRAEGGQCEQTAGDATRSGEAREAATHESSFRSTRRTGGGPRADSGSAWKDVLIVAERGYKCPVMDTDMSLNFYHQR